MVLTLTPDGIVVWLAGWWGVGAVLGCIVAAFSAVYRRG